MTVNSLSPGKFFMVFCRLLIFQNQLFRKILSGIPSECQTDWIKIRPDIMSGLIWVQPICNGYEQTTLVGKELTKAKNKTVFVFPNSTDL